MFKKWAAFLIAFLPSQKLFLKHGKKNCYYKWLPLIELPAIMLLIIMLLLI